MTALDSYVIRGVSHNIALLRDILTEPNFVSGNINTTYLPTTYPDGFKGKQFTPKEFSELVALASAFFCKAELRSHKFVNNTRLSIPYFEPKEISVNVQISCRFDVRVENLDEKFLIHVDGTSNPIEVDSNINLAAPVCHMNVNGKSHIVQLIAAKLGQGLRIRFKGTALNAQLMTKQAVDFLKLMPEKPKVDMSKQILSPMPGLVKSVDVEVGQMLISRHIMTECTLQPVLVKLFKNVGSYLF